MTEGRKSIEGKKKEEKTRVGKWKTLRKKKRNGIKKKKLINAQYESNTKTVAEEHVSAENVATFWWLMIMMK